MYAHVNPGLRSHVFFASPKSEVKAHLGDGAVLFDSGRRALLWGLKVANIGPGDNVLMPASICNVVLTALIDQGVSITYYSLDMKLRYDLSEIRRKIDLNTRAIYVVNYFGFCDRPKDIRSLCDEEKLLLIEDCAHSFLSETDGEKSGSSADISIYSFKKSISVPDGGALKINVPFPTETRQEKRLVPPRELIALFLHGFLEFVGFPLMLSWRGGKGKQFPVWEDNVIESADQACVGPSTITQFLITKFDLSHIKEVRRQNFMYWLKKIEHCKHVTPLYDNLPEGVSPYSFPILVSNHEEVFVEMIKKGAYLEPSFNYTFRSFPNLLNYEEEFPTVDYIASHLLSLPVHQGITFIMIDEIWDNLHVSLVNSSSCPLPP